MYPSLHSLPFSWGSRKLRYTSFLFLLILFTTTALLAQAPAKQWDKTFGGSANDEAKTVLQCSDGGFLFAGFSLSGISGDKTEVYRGDKDGWLVKTDANGNKLWDKTLGSNGEDTFTSVIQTSDGGFLVAGSTSSDALGDVSAPNKGAGSDYWVVKISGTGVKQWDKRYGGNQSDYITSAKQTSDGGYILSGFSNSGQSGDKSEPSRGKADFWIVKITSTGVKQWDKTFGGNGEEQASSIIQSSFGGYAVAGWSESGISGEKSEASRGLRDYWLVKLSDSGAKEWDKTFGGSGNDESSQLIETLYGYMLSGTSTSGISVDRSEPNRGAQDFWIVKTNIYGDKWWDKTYGGSGSDGNSSMVEFYDGYLFIGYSNSGISGDKTESSRGLNDFWVVKSDFDGNKLWDKTFGGTNDDYAYSSIQAQDAGLILAGMSKSGISGDKTTANKGSADYWVVKLNPVLPKAPALTAQAVSRTAVDIKAYGSTNYDCFYEEYLPKYIIEKSSNANGPFSVKDTLSTTCYESTTLYGDNYLLPNTTYYYRVKALVGRTASPYSSTVSTKTMSDVTSPVNAMAEWNKRFGGTQDETMQTALRTSDGGYLLAGSSRSGLDADRSETSRGGLDFWIVKLAANGIKQWDKRYGGTSYDGLHTAIQTSDGGFILGGTSSSIVGGDKSEGNKGAGDYWIVKISSSGVKEWDKTFGGSALDELRSVIQTSDGGYLLGAILHRVLAETKQRAAGEDQIFGW
ncbi:fibronectin type III domain-containing protein [Rhodocytophaga rosea]|uniref:Fibronectin type III domain-containing protein n=1 Tax=Rhodocytophaga rosea TaxID=2704465 RepID=A0A6C0GPP9_9BACT|nr:fibronectin type III domain-containing protein [Rhodocytophaga rosea]QHT70045.1 fibronectin type III domain-containing protein [Rhodocytophaga rosea]